MNSDKTRAFTRKIICFSLFVIGLPLFNSPALADEKSADDCSSYKSALEERLCEEIKLRSQRFVLVPHKPNYFIFSWDHRLRSDNPIYDNIEIKFQLSFKVPLNQHHPETKWLWFFGYTQTSVWQTFNFDQSAPFRDTNFEPELMVSQLIDYRIPFIDWDLRMINYGLIDHQSNGKVPPNSRSWNKSYINFILEKERNYITFKTWYRWKEKDKVNPTDFKGDDNPDIEHFLGHGELKFFHAGPVSNYSISYRDSSKGAGRGTYQLDWSEPVSERKGLRLYVQYFNGYGETLIDYNIKRERLGIGIMLTDWL